MGSSFVYSRREGKVVIVIIKDSDDRKLDTFKWNEKDKKMKNMCLKTIRDKYGIDLKPTIDPDLEWLP